MKINENSIKKTLKNRDQNVLTTAYFENDNIVKFSFSPFSLSNLQFLSLKRNNLKDISFIKFLPRLWYLDISLNPVSFF